MFLKVKGKNYLTRVSVEAFPRCTTIIDFNAGKPFENEYGKKVLLLVYKTMQSYSLSVFLYPRLSSEHHITEFKATLVIISPKFIKLVRVER